FFFSLVFNAVSKKLQNHYSLRLLKEKVKSELMVPILKVSEPNATLLSPCCSACPACIPVRTTTVNVGFHCLPSDTTVDRSGLSSFFEKSIDLRDTAEAHLACRCTPQCA
nr:vitellogenin [Oreochromis mossambicus]